MTQKLSFAVLAAGLVLAGNASAQATDTTAAHPAAPPADSAAHAAAAKPARVRHVRPARSNVLSPEEIADSREANLFQLIQRVRPAWLNRGGPTDPVLMVAYNGNIVGSVDVTWQYRPEQIRAVTYLSSVEGRARYGPQGSGGVLDVRGI